MKALLKDARDRKGLKTREVANLLKIDHALISKYENGLRRPTKAQALQLAELLEIDKQTILIEWLKEKILYEIEGQDFILEALAEVQKTINPESTATSTNEDAEALQKLFDEMDALKNKFKDLRGS